MAAVESRTSSPVRITRDPEKLNAINVEGLFPAGEGAGYAGGIVSSAVDGMLVAGRVARDQAVEGRALKNDPAGHFSEGARLQGRISQSVGSPQ